MAESPKANVLFERIRSLAKFPDEDPDPVLRVRIEGRVLYANPPADLLLEEWGIKVGEDVPDEIRTELTRATTTGDPIHTHVRAQGKTFRLTIAPLAGEKYVNIYGRTSSHFKLVETLREIRELCDQIAPSVTDADVSKKISDLRSAAERAAGYV